MTSGSLRYYYRDEVNNETNEKHPAGNYRINTSKTTTNKSFEYKTKIIRTTPDDGNILYADDVVPLKYLRNFWRSLEIYNMELLKSNLCDYNDAYIFSERQYYYM